jgi:hypothetical protein
MHPAVTLREPGIREQSLFVDIYSIGCMSRVECSKQCDDWSLYEKSQLLSARSRLLSAQRKWVY